MTIIPHPVEIAQEIKDWPFFHSFDESLLLQISTMIRPMDFPAGYVLLNPEQTNSTLYFLREGIVEIMVDGEKVNELTQIGEVLGEISVLSGKPVSAQIRTQTPIRCFALMAEDFAHVNPTQKDRFQFLLYRIYAGILTDRLMKTNKKAKLYEITARELALKKRELEMMTSAQMNLMRAEQTTTRKTVLLLEPSKKQQTIIKTAVGGTGVHLLLASTIDEAKGLFAQNIPDLIFCEESCSDFMSWAHDQNYPGEFVMIESETIHFSRLLSLPFVHNVISRETNDRAGTVKSLLTCLSKILHRNYFGIEKYVSWGTDIRSQNVTKSTERASLREQMLEHFKSLGIRSALLDRVQVATEEMLMNAIYDAPVDMQGKALFNHLPRTVEIRLHDNQQAQFRYGCDGNLLAVSVQDPFGSLTREVIIKYLESCYGNRAGSLNEAKGGAGRGLHQILESCDWTVFNIKPGEKTEVIGLFDLDQKRDGPPQFHYFFVK
jgi:CRP-like cAMP-binding protein